MEAFMKEQGRYTVQEIWMSNDLWSIKSKNLKEYI